MHISAYLDQTAALFGAAGQQLTLAPPASAASLAALRQAFPFPLLESLLALWQQGDGSEDWQPLFARSGYLSGYRLLSIAEAQTARAALRRRAPQYAGYTDPEPRDPRIRPGWFHEGWLPFAEYCDCLLLVDCCPPASGSDGQIIAYDHDPDRITFAAANFAAFLAASQQMLQEYPVDCLQLDD